MNDLCICRNYLGYRYNLDDNTVLLNSIYQVDLDIRPHIKICGNVVRQARDVRFYSDYVNKYRYSGTDAKAHTLSTLPYSIIAMISNLKIDAGFNFNGVLINRYTSGGNYIGSHSDNTSDLISNTIMTLSMGSSRNFRIRDKNTKKIVLDLQLNHGDLIIMCNNFQKKYKHEITKTDHSVNCRISLTFRQHNDNRKLNF